MRVKKKKAEHQYILSLCFTRHIAVPCDRRGTHGQPYEPIVVVYIHIDAESCESVFHSANQELHSRIAQNG
jgi:hypothetical protein